MLNLKFDLKKFKSEDLFQHPAFFSDGFSLSDPISLLKEFFRISLNPLNHNTCGEHIRIVKDGKTIDPEHWSHAVKGKNGDSCFPDISALIRART